MSIYLYLNKPRIESLSNDIMGGNLKEIIVGKETGKNENKGYKIEFSAGILKAESHKNNEQQQNFNDNIRVTYEIENKLNDLKKIINFQDIKIVQIEKLLIGNAVKIETDFFSKELKSPEFYKSQWDGKSPPYLYKKLKNKNIKTIKVVYHPENMLSATSWSHLSGHKKFSIYGIILDIKNNCITIAPLSIGLPENVLRIL